MSEKSYGEDAIIKHSRKRRKKFECEERDTRLLPRISDNLISTCNDDSCDFYDVKQDKGVSITYAKPKLKLLHENFQQFLEKRFNSCLFAKSDKDEKKQSDECKTEKLFGSDDEIDSSTAIDVSDWKQDIKTYGSSPEILKRIASRDRKHEEETRYFQEKLLSKDLQFNMKEKEASNCQCNRKHINQWVIHGIFEGEKVIPKCCLQSNNAYKLWHYRLFVNPTINFKASLPTLINYQGQSYTFEGFSLLSHHSLEKIPPCTFIRYNREYTVTYRSEEMPKNFCINDLDLFGKYVFEELFDINDWKIRGEDGCKMFHFMPRFVWKAGSPMKEISESFRDAKSQRRHTDIAEEWQHCRELYEEKAKGEKCSYWKKNNQDEKLLPMSVVIEYLLESFRPVIEPICHHWSMDAWKEYESSLRNSLVVNPEKMPHCIRLDGLMLDERQVERKSREESESKHYPRIIHNGGRSARMNYMSDKRYLKLKQAKNRLRNQTQGRAVPIQAHIVELKRIEAEIRNIKAESDLKKNIEIKLSAKGMYKTGLNSDIAQHLVSLHSVVDHIRYHKSLEVLEDRINYKFNNRNILQTALFHSSTNLDSSSSSHLKVAELNCGVYSPAFGSNDVYKPYKKEKGILKLSKVMMTPAESKECLSNLKHNESLEFLGDAILEFITSRHLFFLFGGLSEGSLNTFRSALVQNKHLTEIAKRLGLEHFMYFGHGFDVSQSTMDHMLGNCVEAILGAVYLDGDYEEAEKLVCNLLFQEEDLRELWMNIPKHEIQIKEPNGDRHLISEYDVLRRFVTLEEQIGIEFNHICLLAKAFKHPSSNYSNIIGGNNQRLEYFGDSILKMLVSDYLYKHFPNHQEGHLTLLRTSLINEKIQASVCEELGLQNYLIYQNEKAESGTTHVKRLADTFEAFLAAIYVDKGIEYCRKICDVCFIPKLENFITQQRWIDPKSYLQQCCSFKRDDSNRKENPIYRLLEATGPVQNKTFRAAVYFKGKRIGTGTANSIQGAEMAAAENALRSNYFEHTEKRIFGTDKASGDERIVKENEDEGSLINAKELGKSPQWVNDDG